MAFTSSLNQYLTSFNCSELKLFKEDEQLFVSVFRLKLTSGFFGPGGLSFKLFLRIWSVLGLYFGHGPEILGPFTTLNREQ